jgi:indole-3-glycerol phosphate synthase
MNVLDEIFANKRLEVEQSIQEKSLAQIRLEAETALAPIDFRGALLRPAGQRPRLVAEVKQASPSHGLLSKNFCPLALAKTYKENGAAAISVLTDQRYFRGCLADLRQVAAQAPRLPVLRKDFVFSPYQVYEARAAGASAILLIAAMIEPGLLVDLRALAIELGMAALVEVHNLEELESVLKGSADLIGINNRNLHNLSVSLDTTHQLRAYVPTGVCLVSESGIHHRKDVDRLMEIGIDAILVGEALVTAPDTAAKVAELAQ